jgi:hypothetical protein
MSLLYSSFKNKIAAKVEETALQIVNQTAHGAIQGALREGAENENK